MIAMPQEILKKKLEAIRDLVGECLQQLGAAPQAFGGTSHAVEKEELAKDITLQIVNKVGNCEESEDIQKQILDKRGAEGRILLGFYISYKYFSNEWLTSGDIENITAELGVKIDGRNVTNYLKEYRKHLESGAARKKGQSTPYRLNRMGAKRFEEIIHAKES
jgi:hypothetical protein